MASGSRLEADHRHLSLNSRARSLGIEEGNEGRGEEATHHGTELDHCAAGTGSTGQSIEATKQRAGTGAGRGGIVSPFIHC